MAVVGRVARDNLGSSAAYMHDMTCVMWLVAGRLNTLLSKHPDAADRGNRQSIALVLMGGSTAGCGSD